jgi:hypothetical protein
MVATFRTLAVLTAALSLAGAAAADGPSTAGATPCTGARVIDLSSTLFELLGMKWVLDIGGR